MNLDPRLLRLVRAHIPVFGLALACGTAGSLLAVAQASALSGLVAGVLAAPASGQMASAYLLALLAATLLRAGAAWGLEASGHRLAGRIKAGLRERLFHHLVVQPPRQPSDTDSQDSERSGELANLLVEGVEALDPYYSQYLPQLILAAAAPASILLFVLPRDLLSGIVLLVTAPLIPIFMALTGSLANALTRRQWTALSRLSAYFLEVIQGLTTLITLGRSQDQLKQIESASQRFRVLTMSVLRVSFLSTLSLELIATLSTAVVAVQVGLRLLYGYISFEQAFFILILAPEFYQPLRMLGTRFHAGMSGAAAAGRIFDLLEAKEPTSHQPALDEAKTPVYPAIEPDWELEFRSVGLEYKGGRQALHDVSFKLPAGHKLALVGPSGGGKTSLAHLLLGFAAPTRGEILANGQTLDELGLAAWRSQVAWVPQNPYLFNDTVAANIRLGNPGASMEEVTAAARQAHAHEFIQALPQGYETCVGEHAARLSAGQAQRLALARAFLKDAPLLVLDEATAHLDPENERLALDALNRLEGGRTVVIIAHRLQTIRQADQIVVLEAGRVAQVGSHTQLIEQDGPYRKMLVADGQEGGLDDYPDPLSRARVQAGPERSMDTGRGQSRELLFEKEASVSNRQALLHLLRLAAPFKGQIALSTLLGAAAAVSGMGLMGTAAFIISTAGLQPSIAELQVAIVGVRFFGLARAIFRYLERYVSHQVTFQVLAQLRTWFYRSIEPLAPAGLLRYRSGDLLGRSVGDIAALENFFVRGLAPPLAAVLVSAAAAATLAGFGAHLASGLLLFLVLAGAGTPLGVRLLSRRPGRQFVQARAAMSGAVIDGIQGRLDLLAYGQQNRQANIVRHLGEKAAQAQARLADLNGLQTALGILFSYGGMALVLALSMPMLAAGQLEWVYLGVLALVALTSFEGVLSLPQAAVQMETSLAAARRLLEVVQARPEVCEPNAPPPLPAEFDFSVKNLHFRYPQQDGSPSEPEVLQGISFELPAGKKLAIIGPSGVGKSTLASLLLRFWEYQVQGGGEIFLAGIPLHCYSPRQVRSQIGVVSQNPFFFTGTLRDNLRLGCPSASMEDIDRAAGRAQLRSFIQSLPQGYDTWLGEGGYNLSAGERQRLAVARALVKEPQLLILDEVSANLDPLTERRLLDALRDALPERSLLALTHRLVGMEWMDEILVLLNGRVAERGTHTSLLALGGLYRRLWELQHGWGIHTPIGETKTG